MSHWYDKNGQAMHEVPNASKKGEFRDTTLRDARKLQLAPSVTTVTKLVDKGDIIVKWGKRQAIYSAVIAGVPQFTLVDGSLSDKDPDFVKWADACIKDAESQVRVKSERGTILHDMMSRAWNAYDSIEPQYLAHIDGMMELLEKNFGKRRWIAEKCFAHELGFGGSVDLQTVDDDEDQIILDYKFKDFDSSREASYFVYDEHKMQLGGYSIGLRKEKARLFNAFGSISDPGLALLHAHTAEDAAHGRRMFLAALNLWQAKNQYVPQWGEK